MPMALNMYEMYPFWNTLFRELGFKVEQCAFIGDGDADVITAKNAGFASVAVSWGFRDREALEKLHPDIIIDAPTELLEIFD